MTKPARSDGLSDPVSHPPHYRAHPSGVECIQITEHMNFCLGNAVKYIWRADEKGNAVEDLKKAVFYINREIERRTLQEQMPEPAIVIRPQPLTEEQAEKIKAELKFALKKRTQTVHIQNDPPPRARTVRPESTYETDPAMGVHFSEDDCPGYSEDVGRLIPPDFRPDPDHPAWQKIEEDEPVEQVKAAFEAGEKGRTECPECESKGVNCHAHKDVLEEEPDCTVTGYCCGCPCEKHPIGKPWGWNAPTWNMHYRLVHPDTADDEPKPIINVRLTVPENDNDDAVAENSGE